MNSMGHPVEHGIIHEAMTRKGRQALEPDFEDFIDVLANASSKDDDDNAVEILS